MYTFLMIAFFFRLCYNRNVLIHKGRIMIITFCGHSNYLSCLEDEERLLNLIETVACGKQVDFYLGGYGGFDGFALNCARRYKEYHKNVKLVYIAPYIDKWLEERRDNIKKYYDEIVYPNIESIP